LASAIDILQRLASKLTGQGKTQDEFFQLPVQPYGIGDTERCIEIPWAISCYRGERRVLDVGYANAEDRYLDSLIALGIPELYGLDLAGKAVQGIH